MKPGSLLTGTLASLCWAGTAQAVVVNWADLTNATTNQVTGTLDVNGTSVAVSYSGPYIFAQTNGAGTDYWTEPNASARPYTGGSVSNRPPGTDIVALAEGGSKTITFSQPLDNLYLGLVSWNGNNVSFDRPFQVISEGCGFWGCGTFASVTSTSFTGSGELHGIIRFEGPLTSLTFTDTSENWHGFQVGVAALRQAVPEPAAWALMIVGFGLAGSTIRARKIRVGFA
jgi:hypothetical protein